MPKPEQYQMGFDFVAKPDRSLVYYELGFAGSENLEGSGRFVRQLREEIVVRSPQDAAEHLMTNVFSPFEVFDQEELWLCIVNSKQRITHEAMVYRGTVNSINIRLAEIFKEPIRVNAPALLLSHNHPGQDPTPSPEDVKITQNAVQAGNLLGITVLDHIIVGKDVWFSLKEKGLGFSE